MKLHYVAILIVLLTALNCLCIYAYDVTLAWDSNSAPNIVRYNLYIRTNDSEPFNLVDEIPLEAIDPNHPQWKIKDLEDNITYSFVVTAVNDDRIESPFSNEVSLINGQEIVPVESSGNGDGGGCFISTISSIPPIKETIYARF